MKRQIYIFFFVCTALCLSAQNVKDLQKQQKKIQQEIAQTNELLQQTKQNEKATTNKLNLINKNIKDRKRLINSINGEINALDNDMTSLTNKRNELQNELECLKDDYANLIRKTHYADMQSSPLLFLFSADDFHQLVRRIRYMREFTRYRKQQVAEIENTQHEIDIQNDLLAQRKGEKEVALQAQTRERDNLARDERKQQKMLSDLKKKKNNLTAQLKKQQKQADEINKKIEQMINKQTQTKTSLTPEQKLIAGGFAANQGKLPWPVEKGFISGYFGVHQHPVHEHVTINNKGIYLQTTSGSSARAVYEGEVSSVLVLGNMYAVIVQHGNYRSVYSKLASVNVKQGDKVKAKQNLGKIFTDPDDDNKTELYFQIYQDRTLLNPSLWLAK